MPKKLFATVDSRPDAGMIVLRLRLITSVPDFRETRKKVAVVGRAFVL
jgi:hypothetical protein